MIDARPRTVAIDASSLVVFKGEPDTPVIWSVSGNGTLYPIDLVTNSDGVASGVLYPTGAAGDVVVVRVAYLSGG